MNHITCLFFVLLVSLGINAQTGTISGTIMDGELNEPLPGANVIVKGTTNGTTTDFDGNFIITDVAIGDVLTISYIGYVAKEVTIASFNDLSVSLLPDLAKLDEVVVIGYGTQTKKEITGAVSVVGAETIEELKPARIEQALQGQVPGVNITSQSGAPGAALTINIRGVSTNGDNRPLILLDGNVIEDLSVVNPGDIESINVLKDATAGIYGVRAANGVVLITTKTGRKSTPLSFTYDAFAGFQQTTRRLPLLNATEYAIIKNEAAAAVGDALPYPNVAGLGVGTDWQDEVFQNAPIFNHSLNISGGTEKSTYSMVFSTLTQDGIVGGNKANFRRYNSRVNFTTELIENLNFKTNFIYTNTNRRTLPESGLGSVLFNALNMAPTLSARANDGSFTRAVGHPIEVINPLAQMENTFNKTQVDKLSGVIGLNYKFLDNFKATANYQWNYSEVRFNEFRPILDFGNIGPNTVFDNAIPTLNQNFDIYRDYTFDAFIDYENSFGGEHDLKVTLGTSVFRSEGDLSGGSYLEVSGTSLADVGGFTTGAYDLLRFPAFEGNRFVFDSRLLSYFARVQYDYKGKYLLSGVVRRDGSSKFGPENKFGYFTSTSMGWIVSDEEFFMNDSFINFLKLRGSYGVIGNDRIADFQFVSLLDGEGVYVLGDELVIGNATGAISNPEIKWEQQYTLDIGFDAKLFNNAVDITFDYFNRKTENLLLLVSTSGLLGTNAPGAADPIANAGSVRNRGAEFSIGYRGNISEDLSFNTNFNMTYLDNEVLSVNNGTGVAENPGAAFGIGQSLLPARMEAGFPMGYFYGYKTDGIFQNTDEIAAHPSQIELGAEASPGDLRFVDLNGDGVLNSDDRTNLGDPIPDFTMGLNLNFDYKNFDFKTYFFASIGNDIVRNYVRNDAVTNESVYQLNRWTGEGSTNSAPRVTNGATANIIFSDYFVEDGSFVRAQNMQLGYTFDRERISKMGVKNLRLYVSANNVFTLTKYKGFDPSATSGEPIGGGIDRGFYPVPRTYMLGVNLKF